MAGTIVVTVPPRPNRSRLAISGCDCRTTIESGSCGY